MSRLKRMRLFKQTPMEEAGALERAADMARDENDLHHEKMLRQAALFKRRMLIRFRHTGLYLVVFRFPMTTILIVFGEQIILATALLDTLAPANCEKWTV